MPYIFWKLWHLAIIWPIMKSFQCILQGVRFLLANQTLLSGTSENESYAQHNEISKHMICFSTWKLSWRSEEKNRKIKMSIFVKWETEGGPFDKLLRGGQFFKLTPSLSFSAKVMMTQWLRCDQVWRNSREARSNTWTLSGPARLFKLISRTKISMF